MSKIAKFVLRFGYKDKFVLKTGNLYSERGVNSIEEANQFVKEANMKMFDEVTLFNQRNWSIVKKY